MEKNQIIILVVFLLYMAAMVGVGLFFNRRNKTSRDYVLGNRELNPWVTALSAQASDMSGWLLTGLPGLAVLSALGAKEAFYTALGLFIGTGLNWILVAKRLRVYTEVARDSLTIPDYFVKRFADDKKIIGLVAGIIILVFFTVYTASMFAASAKLFNSIFGLDYKWGLLVGFLVIVLYTFFGGFKAVSWTDLFQGFLMLFALLLVPIIVASKLKGVEVEGFKKFAADAFLSAKKGGANVGAIGIIGAFAWGLGYFGMPHILVRFMATKDKKTIKPATTIAMIWVFVSLAGAILVGLVGNSVMPTAGEQIFMKMVQSQFTPFIAGIILSAVLAAIMSTADSQLLVASSAFSIDIYKNHIRKNAKDKEVLLVAKISIVIIAVIAVLFALDPDSSVFKLVQFAWGGFGAAFGPVVLFSLFSKKIKKSAAISSMITGAVTCIIFKYGLSRLGGFWTIYELLPGFILATIVLWAVSFIDKRPIPEIVAEQYDTFKRKLKDDSDADIASVEDNVEAIEVVEENENVEDNIEYIEVREESANIEDNVEVIEVVEENGKADVQIE